MGSLPGRTGLGHGPRGLQRARHGLGLLPARPRALAGLPVERGRHGRHLRRPADVLLRAGAVERRGPDPQGADVRPRRRRRQPRRGRQGVLVVPGLHAHPLVDALALPLPAGRLPVRRAGRGRTRCAAATRSRSTSWSTPVSSTTTGTGRSPSTTPRRRRPTCASLVTVANRGPEAATLHVLPTLWFRNTWAWGLPEPTGSRADRQAPAGSSASTASSGSIAAGRRRRAARRCSATTRPTPSGSGACPARSPYPKDGINDHVVDGAPTVNPAGMGTKGALHYVLTVPAGGQPPDPAAADPDRDAAAPRAASGDLGAGFDAVMRAPPGRGRRVLRRADPGGGHAPRRRWWPGRRSPG